MRSDFALLHLLLSILCLLSVTIAAKKRCELCSKRSHVFRDHLFNGDNSIEEIRTIIEGYFGRLKKRTPIETYFKVITSYLTDDVDYILKQPKFELAGKDLVIDVFRAFLSAYRDHWNPALKQIEGQVAKIKEAITQISSSEIQEAMIHVLSREFQKEFTDRQLKRRLQSQYQTGPRNKAPRQTACLLCYNRSDHQFIEHIVSFNFDDSFRRMAKAYFERYKCSNYARYYIEMLVKYLSVYVNQMMEEYASSHPRMKAALVEIFDQLISSYVEYRNPQAIRVQTYLVQLEEAILRVVDEEIQTSACSIIIRRIVLISKEAVQFPIGPLLLEKLSSLNLLEGSGANNEQTADQISKAAEINYGDSDIHHSPFDQSIIDYMHTIANDFTEYDDLSNVLLQ